jgi:hypothetical protein
MSDLVRIPNSAFPKDSDGFLSRECPECEGRFKVSVSDEPENDGVPARDEGLSDDEILTRDEEMQRYCPLCHQAVRGNRWWTPEQIEFAEEAISAAVQIKFQEMLKETANKAGGLLEFRSGGTPAMPSPPEESEGMILVAPPCHEEDPLKIPATWSDEVACHQCGVRYPVDVIRR